VVNMIQLNMVKGTGFSTIRKYHITPSLYSRWKLKYLQEGISGLKDKHKKIDPEVRALELDNERLKRIIAKQALEIEVKSELLKKTPVESMNARLKNIPVICQYGHGVSIISKEYFHQHAYSCKKYNHTSISFMDIYYG
jgi:regulator of replication initiation timing